MEGRQNIYPIYAKIDIKHSCGNLSEYDITGRPTWADGRIFIITIWLAPSETILFFSL